MRSHSKRTLQTLLLLVALFVLFHAPTPPPARGVGATRVGAPPPSPFTPDGALLVFSPPAINYTVDGGPLSALVNNAAGIILVDTLVQEWENVPTSAISFANVGSITDPASGLDGTPGDVDTVNELVNLGTMGNPFVFDADGSITEGIFGFPSLTLGFAGAAVSGPPGQLVAARAVLNGKFRDGVNNGIDNFEATPSEFEGVILHETGHYFGLAHDQGNDNCEADSLSCDIGGVAHDDAFGYPTMAPISLPIEETMGVHPFRTLSISDVAAVSFLYPETVNNPPTQIPFVTGFANITGNIMSSMSVAIQGGNVIARYATDDPMTATDERRACLITNVSGYRFTGNLGQNVTGDNPGSSFGSRDPSLFGFYELPVPRVALTSVCGANTDYTVEVESINPTYLGGSSVGPLGQRFVPAMVFDGQGEQIPLPGPAEFFSSPETNNETLPDTPAVVSVAGGDQAGIDIILNGTPPSLDAFDSVSPNNSPATATSIGDGTTTGSISGFFGGLPDEDYYAFTALPGGTVTLEIFARRAPHNDRLDGVLQIVDGGGLQQDLCDTVTPGDHTGPCFNDDIIPGTIRDPMLSFESTTGGTFFVRVLNYFGNPHVSHQYDLVVTGAGQAPPAAGCTKDFDGGGVAALSWADGANWNPDGVPGPSDDVCIGAFSVQYDAGTTTIDTLTVATTGTLAMVGAVGANNLNVTTSASVSGSVNASGGTLNLPASTIADLTMNGGTVNFLSGTSTISNSLTFNSGTLVSSNPGTIVNLPAAGYTQSNGTLRLNSGSFTTAGTITLAGGVIEGGTPGTLTANMNQTAGTISPGLSPGLLNVTGNLTQAAAGSLNIEIGGLAAGTEHDQLSVSGTVNVGGTFNVTLINPFTPALNDTFTIAMCAGGPMCGSGMPTINLPALPAGLAWDTDVNSDDTMLVLTVVAATKDFDGGGDGTSWTDPMNWTGDTLPGLGDDVGIGVNPAFPGPFTVTKNAAGGDIINSLTVADEQGVFTVSNPLNIAADSTIGSGGLAHTAGFLTLSGALDIAGPFTWSGGVQNGLGTTTANGGITFSPAAAITLDGRTLTSTGAVIYNGAGNLSISNATFNNNATFDLQTDADILAGAAPQIFNNNGTFTKSGAGASSITAAFNNAGVVNVSSGTLDVRAANCGSVCNGAFNVAAGATLIFSGAGPSELGAGSSTSGAGTVDFSATTVNHAGTHNVTGATLFSGGTANLTGNVVSVGTLTINSGGVANFSSGEVIMPAGTVTLNNGMLTGSDTVTISGLLDWVQGTQTGTGITNANGGITLGAGAKTLSVRTLNNGVGSIATFSGAGNLSIGSGAIFNNNGTFDLQSDADILDFGGVPRTFNNNATGTFTKSAGAASSFTVDFNNAGTVIAGAGVLTFSGVYMQTAGVTRLNGGSITKTVTDLTLDGGALESPGPGGMITGNVANNGATVRPGTSPGSLVINGNYTQGALGVLDIELGGTTPGTQFDVLAIGGAATLDGTLNALSFGGFTPGFSDSFQIMTFGSRSGDFVAKNLTVNGVTLLSLPGAINYVLMAPAAAADLAVSKADSPDPILLGSGNITYTVTVTNNGPDAATNVALTDTLPGGVTFVSATPSQGACTTPPVAGVLTCNLGTINNAANAVVTIVVTPTAGGVLSNTASASATEADPTPGNNSDTETTTVNTPLMVDLAVTKSDSPDPAVVGQNITYTVTVSNAGPDAASNVTLTDTLPAAGIAFVSATPSQGTCTTPPAGNVLTCDLGAITSGANATVTIVITPVAAAVLSNMASATTTDTDPNSANNTDTETTTVNPAATATTVVSSLNPSNFGDNVTFTATVSVSVPGAGTPTGTVDFFDGAANIGSGTVNAGGQATFATSTLAAGMHSITATYNGDANFTGSASPAITQTVNALADLSVSKTDSPDPVTEGQNITYTITVANAGPSAATNVTVTDPVPAGVTFAGFVSISQGTATFSGGTVTGSFGTINSGANATLVFRVSTSAASVPSVSNTATVSATENDPNTANNSDTETTTVNPPSADVSVTKTDVADPVDAGQNVTYTINVANAGPDAATNFTLTDMVPANTTFASFMQNSGPAFTLVTPPVGGAGTVTASVASLASGTSASFTLVVATTAGAVPGISNTATVSANEMDPVAANNSDTETTAVNLPTADVSVTKTDSPDPVTEGQNITYTITVANAGPSAATSVTVTDPVPAGVTFAGFVSISQGTATFSGGTVTGSFGTINSGANATLVFQVSTSAASVPSVSNTATVSAAENDPNTANNSDTETTTVNPPTADLAVTKTDAPDPATAGQNVTYTITVTNGGPDPATNASLMDAVPANTTFVSFTAPAGWTSPRLR